MAPRITVQILGDLKWRIAHRIAVAILGDLPWRIAPRAIVQILEDLTWRIAHRLTVPTSCAHKWGQYTPALISTHPIKKYPTNSPIFKSLWSKIDRDPETYPISINPRDEINRADRFREKLRKPRFLVNFWPPEGQKWGHEHENQ